MIATLLEEGLRHHQAGRLDRAEELYRRVLCDQPEQPDAIHLLGMAAHARGRFEDAYRLVSCAVAANPNEAVFRANLGLVLESLERWDEAETEYRRALTLKPAHATALNNLGNLHRARYRLDEAITCYQSAIAHKPDFPPAHSNLGNTFADQCDFDSAIPHYRRALELDGFFFDARKNLANALAEQGAVAEAAVELERAKALRPADSALKIRSALLLPVIPESLAAIDECRGKLSAKLDSLANEELYVRDPIAETLGPTFYLTYQGRNDLELHRRMAALFARAVPSLAFTAPHCRLRTNRRAGAIRVGLISRFFQLHSIGDHYGGLLRSFPRAGARYTVFRLPGPTDSVSRSIDEAADDTAVLSPRLSQAREQIAARELDLLLYTDIGMDPWTYFLAFARLAPVQCVTLGHPVTTGVPTIDYFLSCDLVEPPGAESHYSERLVRLKSMPHFLTRPRHQDASKRRSDFPLPVDAHWYVCHQTLFKIHPEFDEVLGRILRTDPRGIVVLFSGTQANWQRLLVARFQRSIPDVAERVVFLPRLPFGDYLTFLELADVLIDTCHFGAGTTAYHACALGVPFVTLPGAYARSRSTLAVYRRIGVGDCIASDAADYVQKAVAIAGDRGLRNSIGAKLREGSEPLFSNPAAPQELEAFFLEAVSTRPEGRS